jgi:hypothetical protein
MFYELEEYKKDILREILYAFDENNDKQRTIGAI